MLYEPPAKPEKLVGTKVGKEKVGSGEAEAPEEKVELHVVVDPVISTKLRPHQRGARGLCPADGIPRVPLLPADSSAWALLCPLARLRPIPCRSLTRWLKLRGRCAQRAFNSCGML